MRRQATALIAILGFGLAVAGCSKAPAPPSGGGGGGGGGSTTTNVAIPAADYGGGQTASSFSPAVVTVAAGGTVAWRNNDTIAHTTTSDTNLWNGSLAAGAEFTRVFPTAGTFVYACTIHASMTGRVIVQ